MKAQIGDRIVVAGNKVDAQYRDGKIVDIRHADGSPPYVVEWEATGEQTVVFPGPDCHILKPS